MKKYKLYKVRVLNRYRNSQGQYIRELFLKSFIFKSEDFENKIKETNTINYSSYDTYVQSKKEIKVDKKTYQNVLDNDGFLEYDYDYI